MVTGSGFALQSHGNDFFMGKKLLIFLFLGILMFIGGQQLSAQVFLISIRSEGSTDICQGDPVTIILSVYGGDEPYTVTISGNDGQYLVLEDIDMPYKFEIYPEEDNTFYISDAVDSRDRKGRAYGSVEVNVNPSTPIDILIDRTAFLVTESGVALKSDPPGGYFSGIGVSGNTFYPKVATTVGSPHLLTCTYENEWGCTSVDTEQLYVLSGQSSVSLLSGGEPVYSFCNDGSTYTIRGSNDDGFHGYFELFRAGSSTPLVGYIDDPDPDDDQAILLTDGLSGEYNIDYTYGVGGLWVKASTGFIALDVGVTGIRDLPETACKSDEPYALVPEVSEPDPGATFSFSGPGVSGNQQDGFIFDPGDPEVPVDQVEIELIYTASNGCSNEFSAIVFVGTNPEVSFTLEPACIPAEGGMVYFENLTLQTGSVESWGWDFGDPASGDNNTSDLENPDHFYTEPGPKTITLTATSFEGCTGQFQLDTLLVDHPIAAFTFENDCYEEELGNTFTATPVSVYAELDTIIWTIRNNKGDLLEVIGKDPGDLTMNYIFPSLNNYRVNLYVENTAGCAGEITRDIDLIAKQTIPTTGFTETFDQSALDWVVESADQIESWVLGEPDFEGFESTRKDLAWYTDLPPFQEGIIEHSWVRSPCFDFSSLRNPLIGMDIMKSFEPGKSGAVLQYQATAGGPWQTLGFVGGGENWYNLSSLIYQPGGSSSGWGLETFEPDTEWVTASHPGSQLAGNPHVKFRIAIASGGSRELSPGSYNQGFAFDNFSIIESMHRRSVLEYFTNASGESMLSADSMVTNFAAKYAGIVYDLHYHMDFPVADPMNAYNPYPPASRAFHYGVPTVPFALLNGGVDPEYRYTLDPPDGLLNEELLVSSALEPPRFDLSISVNFQEGQLSGTAFITCLSDSVDSYIQLYMVVLEREVTAYPELNPDGFRNVVLDMVPSTTGTLLGNQWNNGKSVEVDFDWEYVPYIEDLEDLFIVAFLEDRDQGWVLQADAANFSPNVGMGKHESRTGSMLLYPNPARNLVTVYFGEVTGLNGELEIVDISGRKVTAMEVSQGQTSQELDISQLPEGLFMIFWKQSGKIMDHARLIRTH
jgi:PKD repeat protein